MQNLTRSQFLRGSAAIVGASMLPSSLHASTETRTSSLPHAAERKGKRPNVLLVIADEWRAQAFRYRGDPNAPTGALDGFALQSVDFRNAVSGTPLCCPARASLMTGQYPLTHRVLLNDVTLKPTGPTLGESFAGAGYRTGYIGKWHLHGSPEGHWERRLAYVPPKDRFGFMYWKAAECDHNYGHSHYYEGYDHTRKYWLGYDAIAQTEDAQLFIQANAHKGDPYFLVLSYGPPHFPYMAPTDYKVRWENQEISLRPNVPSIERDNAVKELRGYYAAINVLDDCFGRLMETLEATGTAEDTIVIFQADHGEMGYSQGLEYKSVPWEESIRIPFMLRYPRKYGRQGRTIDVPLAMPDIMPTLLRIAGISVPSSVEGFDWSPALRHESAADAPRSTFLNMPVSSGDIRRDGFAEYRGVRTQRYTYVRSIKGPWLLYDNEKDPYQVRNLVATPSMKQTILGLERELADWLHRRGDTFMPGVKYLEEDHLTHYLPARVPIHPVSDPSNQWKSTLSEGDSDTLASYPDDMKILSETIMSQENEN